ncbi:hypothetical protein SAY87_031396 [Trapa incisa]|uniref:Fcf2 pre-rRNA processing C-terminal domain-containing protein n=1 Tax=Trapa incisa TaxID=236973 RepID=A0AAN7KT96_9MYRT|nr:hypothetical protein SAY87_031396 [Trapa incisa]
MSSKAVIGLSWEPKIPGLTQPSSTFTAVASTSGCKNVISIPESSGLWRPNSELVDGLFLAPNDPKKLNKLLKKQVRDTAGSSWFNMPAPTITLELKKDLQMIKLRDVIDPKRHYKKSESKALPKYFQVGTVVESPTDFYNRLRRKERKTTFADELLSDFSGKNYWKRKVREIEEQNRPASNEKWKIKGKMSMKRAKQRRH